MLASLGLIDALTRAANDPKVRSIIIDGDTPGGEAIGVMELAAFVRKVNREPVGSRRIEMACARPPRRYFRFGGAAAAGG